MFILFALFILPNIIASDEEKDFRTTMLELHNLHRGYRNECNLKIFRYTIIPSQKILRPLKWNKCLEEDAKIWARQCINKTEELEGKRVGKWELVGQNIGLTTELYDVLNEWADGAYFYDHETNKCNNTELCNKYKRIVQRNTTHVGCAHHQCENFPERKKNIVVCNYAPSSTEDRPYVDGRKGRCKSNN
uniref:Peptidase inhibitor 16 n=1 Tax=Schistosoma japonicum TaxID=6182 RepID=C1LUQ3_SCHJA|nr:Peptidase inhibitor 16 precursor [Schistosoma japonicum]